MSFLLLILDDVYGITNKHTFNVHNALCVQMHVIPETLPCRLVHYMIYSTIRMDAIKLFVCPQWPCDLLRSRSWFSQSLDLCSINIMVLFALCKY